MPEYFRSPTFVITVILVIVVIVFGIAYKIRRKNNAANPEYQEKLRQRAAEYRAAQAEQEEGFGDDE